VSNYPKVSILIPAFNSAAFIAETLDSAINQSWPNTEIIVVDDGSTDETPQILAAYRQHGLSIIHQDRCGAASARNRAFRVSSGDYIQYLDADDLLSPTKIESQINDLLLSPPLHISSCGWGGFLDTPSHATFTPQAIWKTLTPIDWMVMAWQGGGMMQTACWLTPRSLIEGTTGWDESLISNPNDDGEFFCRVLTHCTKIIFNPEAKVFYRKNVGESLSKQISTTAVKSLLLTCHSNTQQAQTLEDSERVRQACAAHYLNFIYRFHPAHKSLVHEARVSVEKLGVKIRPEIGGARFRWLTKLIGFENALKIRAFFLGRIE